MHKAFRILGLFSLLGFSSCHVSSKTALEGSGGRNAYNVVLQTSNSEQMLLNLVRLRYYDSPFFLDVGTITTQFTYKTSAMPTIPIPGFTKANPFSLGGEFSWQNQPTIQYTPLEGQAFAHQILTPIDLRTIQQLILSGWDVELVFRLVIQSFDEFLNAPEASGPIPEYIPRYKNFREVAQLLHHFQVRSALKVGVKTIVRKKGAEEGIIPDDCCQVLQIAFPENDPEAEKLAGLFSEVQKINGHYAINLELGFNTRGQIGIIPRSILSCMYYLSSAIDVPQEDIDKKKVATTKSFSGEVFDWGEIIGELITVHSSSRAPKECYVSVKYKDHWFYIDECDILSKRTFLLLLQLYNLQAQENKTLSPILALPLG